MLDYYWLSETKVFPVVSSKYIGRLVATESLVRINSYPLSTIGGKGQLLFRIEDNKKCSMGTDRISTRTTARVETKRKRRRRRKRRILKLLVLGINELKQMTILRVETRRPGKFCGSFGSFNVVGAFDDSSVRMHLLVLCLQGRMDRASDIAI